MENKLKGYSVYLETKLVEAAKTYSLGQKLSPVLNELLKLWLENPNLIKEEQERQKKQKENKQND